MTDRTELVRRYDPKLSAVDPTSPLTVGNGSFAFTADVTGLQTLWEDYREYMPLLCQADFGWHSSPDSEGRFYSLSDVEMTRYDFNGRDVFYPVEKQPGNELIYDWLRENPHRLNLMRVRLFKDGQVVRQEEISDISQELDLFTGILTSRFSVSGRKLCIRTAVGESAAVGFSAVSEDGFQDLSFVIDFPYGSPRITGSDFDKTEAHRTEVLDEAPGCLTLLRTLDRERYLCGIVSDGSAELTKAHCVTLRPDADETAYTFSVSFEPYDEASDRRAAIGADVDTVQRESSERFRDFWMNGGIIDVTGSADPRAEELQRRIILSMYLTAVQSCGSMPPQETGLTCNSWYGKFHLEMVPYHQAHFILSGRGRMVERTLEWYRNVLPKARENAKRNGYKGARWPKMISKEAVDSPSIIAPLLIWQQPHIIYMLELLRLSRYGEEPVEDPCGVPETDFLRKYRDLIAETAEFMADFPVYDPARDRYDLAAPLIPSQENHPPRETRNPSFELAEWRFGLETAYRWLKAIGEDHPEYPEISRKLAPVHVANGLIEAREGCDTTYTVYNTDHPSMLFSYGMYSETVDRNVLRNSLKRFRETWDLLSMWGWDFAMLSMVYAKLGDMDEAYEMLLWPTGKNAYISNGHNAQLSRSDLPLYLPGNGSLLMAMALLRDSGSFAVKKEGIMSYPF